MHKSGVSGCPALWCRVDIDRVTTTPSATLSIDGDGNSIDASGAPPYADILSVYGPSQVALMNMGLLNSTGAAIRINQNFSGELSVQSSGLLNNRAGIFVEDDVIFAGSGNELTIVDTQIFDSDHNGIHLGLDRSMTLYGSSVEFSGSMGGPADSTENGIHMAAGSSARFYDSVVSDSNGDGISLEGYASLLIDGGNISGNGGIGISMNTAIADLQYVWIHDNDSGVQVLGADSDLKIRDTTVSDNGVDSFGFGISASGGDTLLVNSTVSGNGFDGVFATAR